MKKKIAVLIPCYNEAQTIGKVVKDFRKALPDADIYVYDNNSKDKTSEIALSAGAIVKKEPKQGKGNVIRSMFRDISADAYIIVDGDDTYPAKHAKEMLDLVLNGEADMVVGDRLGATYFAENKRFGHNFGNKLVRMLISRAFHVKVNDIMTGYRAFSRRFVKTYPVLAKGFEIETEMTIHALDKNMILAEVPVQYRDRPSGSESKLNTVSDGVIVIKTIANLVREYRPLFFFSICSLIGLIIAGILGTIVLINYAETNLVEKFPTLIVAVMFALMSMISFAIGLILDVIAKKHRQLFEIQLNAMCEAETK